MNRSASRPSAKSRSMMLFEWPTDTIVVRLNLMSNTRFRSAPRRKSSSSWPVVRSQTLIVLSYEPDTSRLWGREKSRERTRPEWASRVWRHCPLSRFHILIVSSLEPVMICLDSSTSFRQASDSTEEGTVRTAPDFDRSIFGAADERGGADG